MSKDEYNLLREKQQYLLRHAKSMSYKYGDLKTAKKEGASKEDIDKWIEYSEFIDKYDTVFHHDAQIEYAIGQRLPISKDALYSAPEVVKLIQNELLSGELKKAVESKNIKLDYVKSLIDNSPISEAYHKAKADGSNPELVKAVEDLLGKPTQEPTPQPTKAKELADKGIGKYEKKAVRS